MFPWVQHSQHRLHLPPLRRPLHLRLVVPLQCRLQEVLVRIPLRHHLPPTSHVFRQIDSVITRCIYVFDTFIWFLSDRLPPRWVDNITLLKCLHCGFQPWFSGLQVIKPLALWTEVELPRLGGVWVSGGDEPPAGGQPGAGGERGPRVDRHRGAPAGNWPAAGPRPQDVGDRRIIERDEMILSIIFPPVMRMIGILRKSCL